MFNSVLDYELIFGEYEQYHDFHYDFDNIYFVDMRLKIMALPNFREIIALRYRFLNGDKMTNEERKRARKLLNLEQLEALEINKQEIATNKLNSTIAMIRNTMLKNSEKGGKHG